MGTPTCGVPVATTPTSNDEQQSPDLQETTARTNQEQTPASSRSSTTMTDQQAMGPPMPPQMHMPFYPPVSTATPPNIDREEDEYEQ